MIDTEELGGLSPLLGHGDNGESKIYEGLYRVQEGQDDRIPDAVPVLAVDAPEPVGGDLAHWRVHTRTGVTFSDGTPFGPADVAATYNAVVDPAFASPIAAQFDFIESVQQSGPDTVDFHLTGPYGDVPHRLFLSIAPARYFREKVPADRSPLADHPIGTGPYVLESLRPDQLVLRARADHRDGTPAVKRFVVRRTDDDRARAAQLRASADGTRLPAELAGAVAKDGYRTVTAKSGDWLGITLPSGNRVAGDPAVRLALNLAVDRQAMVRDILHGGGTPVSTLVTSRYGAAYDRASEFPFDPAQSERTLEAAGWRKGPDGIRAKDGVRAAFPVAYYPTEVVRRDLTMATVAAAQRVGVELEPVPVEKSTMTASYLTKTSFLLGGGGQPYTLDSQLYPKLHSKYAAPGVGSKWDNVSDYTDRDVDRALDAARVETDPAERNALYREVQVAYRRNPGLLALVSENHTYVLRPGGWKVGPTALEPHTHGVAWGPWYSLSRWTR